MDHTCHSQVFSSVTRLLTLTESITEVPNRKVAKPANHLQLYFFLSFFREHSTTMTEAIITRTSAAGSGLLHPHHREIEPFSRDSQALEASTCHYTPFCSIPFCVLNGGYAYTGNVASSTSCSALDNYNTWSALYDGPKVSCCSYVIIVRTLIQLQDHYRPY